MAGPFGGGTLITRNRLIPTAAVRVGGSGRIGRVEWCRCGGRLGNWGRSRAEGRRSWCRRGGKGWTRGGTEIFTQGPGGTACTPPAVVLIPAIGKEPGGGIKAIRGSQGDDDEAVGDNEDAAIGPFDDGSRLGSGDGQAWTCVSGGAGFAGIDAVAAYDLVGVPHGGGLGGTTTGEADTAFLLRAVKGESWRGDGMAHQPGDI